jgi:outer membrane protein assembly factor BamB
VFVFLVTLPLQAADNFLSLGIGWSARLASPLLDSPAVDAEHVYLPLRSGSIVALSLVNGRVVWTADLPIAHGIGVDGQRLFTATASELVALDASSGSVAWRIPLSGVTSAPVARSGWVIVGADRDLLAFRAGDGRLVWRQRLGATMGAPPVVDGDRIYVAADDRSLLAINILDGRILWRAELTSKCGGVTVAGDHLFTGCEDNFFYSLDIETGARRWRWRTGADVIAPAAYDGDRVYFASYDNLVRALDFGSGAQRWRHALDSRPLTGPRLEGELLIVPVGSQLRAIRVKDGTLAGTFGAPGELAAPAVFVPVDSPAGARIVIVTGSALGDLRVYGLAPGAEPTLQPLTEIPGRRLSPDAPPPLPTVPPPDA